MTSTDFISLQQAAKIIPGNPRQSTLYKWVDQGVRGNRLRSIRVGGKVLTTREWIIQFIARSQPDAAQFVAEA